MMKTTWLHPDLIDIGRPIAIPLPYAASEARPKPISYTRPWLTAMTVAVSDLLMLVLACGGAVLGRWLLGGRYELSFYANLWPLLGAFMAVYAGARLYPAIPHVPVDELRRLSVCTSLMFLALATATFLVKDANAYSRGVLVAAWVMTMVLVPTGRVVLRAMLASQPWWGSSVVVVGNTPTGQRTVEMLLTHPEIGFKPIAVVSQDRNDAGHVHGVPVLGGLRQASRLARQSGVTHAILTLSTTESRTMERLLQKMSRLFQHLIFIPRLAGFASLGVVSIDFGGTLGLEVRNRLLDTGRQSFKRLIDLLLVVAAVPVLLPMVGFIMLMIRLDSPGQAFYGHERIGQGGRRFTAWKFRTMVTDADAVLEQAMQRDPDLRAEWETHRKLRNDPRVTRVGQLLRKTSLDELPQLWNVACGEMSLVGPRPIVREECAMYHDFYPLYKRVRPGITGLWQVSGRSDVDFRRRVYIDAYYVRNWSVCLDFYILLRTIRTVFSGRGAY